tara:strand:- start:659 stop:859 length:201 start_codon:yes stop_codon:yes gene_type:complete
MDKIRFTTKYDNAEIASFKDVYNNKKIDVNILLNRIKIEKKNTKIKRSIFYVLVIFMVCLLGTLIF